jgi:hypothetical protein
MANRESFDKNGGTALQLPAREYQHSPQARLLRASTIEKALLKEGPRLPGGEGGIRTLDTSLSSYAPLAGACLRPLGHLSEGRA